MMITQQYLPFALSLLVLGVTNTEAFTLSKPALVVSGPSFVRSLTYLRAEETQEAQEDGDAPKNDDIPAPSGGGGNDILNSPDFLRRKIDVLKSDIEAAEGEIAALTTAVEEGKAEWGEQLEKLQTEVCSCYVIAFCVFFWGFCE